MTSHDTTVMQMPKHSNVRLYTLALVSSMGAIMFGYDLAFVGTTLALKSFQKSFGLTHMTKPELDNFSANVVSLLQAGCFFGALAAAPLADKFGRRIGLLASAIFFVIGSAMQTWAAGQKSLLFAGRAIGGLGVGAASSLVPLFVAESSPANIRGRLVGIYEIGVQFGTLIGFWINYGVSQHIPSSNKQWMIPFAIQLIPGGLLMLGVMLLPESPRWVAKVKGAQAAKENMARSFNLPVDSEYIQYEVNHVIAQINAERTRVGGDGFFAELKEIFCLPLNRKRLGLGVMIFIFMQFTGSNAINYYSPRVFKSIGINSDTTLILTGVYGTVRFITVFFTSWFLVDRFGRTNLMLLGSIGMSVCMFYLGGFVQMEYKSLNSGKAHETGGSIVAILSIFIYAVFYSVSWAGMPWVYCSEIFPTVIRSMGMAICTATHWLFNFVIARSVPYMISNIKGGCYFLFASCLILSVIFVWTCLPETKQVELEDMDILFLEARRNRFGRLIGGKSDRSDMIEVDEEKMAYSEKESI